jgi:predicted aspartyl protease
VPLKIDGKDAEYFFDTGAGISVLGQSEARRLGLVVKPVSGKMGEASGTDVGGLQLTVASDLIIGGLHLKNVPFIVLADGGEPWIHMPRKRRGIIGLPVLLAMQTVRWTPSGSFEFAFQAGDLKPSVSNMLFHNSNPVIQVTVEGKHLNFTLDTGAVDTDLNPSFANALPDLLKTGQAEHRSIEGLGGSNNYDSVLLSSVTFEIGGQSPTLKPAHVFTEHGNGTWAAGNLGMDLLKQRQGFTLDFKAMMLHLE